MTTVAQIREMYAETVGLVTPNLPQWGKFDRGLVGVLLDEIDRLTAILIAGLPADVCPRCFGEGEELHLHADGGLYEKGACPDCCGTGTKQKEIT